MKVSFICPQCQKRLSAPTRMEGRTVNCPNCNSPLIIPTTQSDNISASIQAQPILPPLAMSPPEPVRHQPTLPIAKPIPKPEIILQPVTKATPLVRAAARKIIEFHTDGRISYEWRSVDEAKLAIKELRSAKKQYSHLKRTVMQEMREIRQAYTFGVRQRGSKFMGGGKIGSIVRVFQTLSRDGARRELANQLRPHENKRAVIESRVQTIDEVIIIAESFILEYNK